MKKVLPILLTATILTGSILSSCQDANTTTRGDESSTPTSKASDEQTPTTSPETTAPIEKEQVTLTYWHTLADHHEEALLKRIQAFNDSQDWITVEAQQQPYSEFQGKLLQSVRAGVGPDIVSMFPSVAAGYIDQGFLTDMAPYLNDPSNGVPNFRTEIADGVWEDITQFGANKVFLIPEANTGEVLFYNQDWYDELNLEVPQTWTELEENSKKIFEAKGVAGFGSDSIMDTFLCLVMQAGSSYIDANKKQVIMDKAIAIEKLNWFASGVKDGYFRLVGEDRYFSNPFGSQAVGSYIGSSAGIDYVKAGIPEEGQSGHFSFGVAPIPQEGPVKYINYWGSGYVNLATDEASQEAVYTFIKYLITPEIVAQSAIDFGSIPVYKTARELPAYVTYMNENPAAKALNEQMPYVGHIPSVKGSDQVRTEVDKMIQSVALGLSDAESAYDAFVIAAEAALNE